MTDKNDRLKKLLFGKSNDLFSEIQWNVRVK